MWTITRPGGIREDQVEVSQLYLAREHRILFLRGTIIAAPIRCDHFSLTVMLDDIIALNRDDPVKPITLIIDSPGGSVADGFMLYDVIKASRAPIRTIGFNCASMATIILAAGGERVLMPHSTSMLHLPSTSFEGDTKTMEIRQREVSRIKDQLVDAYMACGVTAGVKAVERGKVRKQILKDIDREYWLSAEEAIAYGLADRLATKDDLFGLESSMVLSDEAPKGY